MCRPVSEQGASIRFGLLKKERTMIRSKTLLTALLSCGLGAGTMQLFHATTAAGAPAVQKMDDYPLMRQALHDLHTAKDSLRDAEPRFHGHRDKAINFVDQAIQECETALAEG
jgi:hypothetical protein